METGTETKGWGELESFGLERLEISERTVSECLNQDFVVMSRWSTNAENETVHMQK